jgi:hypothetical protein
MDIQNMLVERLKKIYDNEEFPLCVLTNVKTDEKRIKMIDFIDMSNRRGDKIGYEEIIALSVVLGNEEQ